MATSRPSRDWYWIVDEIACPGGHLCLRPKHRQAREAANVIVMKRHHPIWRRKHVSVLYARIRRQEVFAVGAVARHLAEVTFWVLTKAKPYRDPMKVSPTQGQARG